MTPIRYPFKIKTIPNKKPGKIYYNEPHRRDPHERATARILLRFGYDLIFIKPVNHIGIQTPDCSWCGLNWEMKSPTKNSHDTFIRDIREAKNQSHSIIVDVSRANRFIQQTAIDIIKYIRKRRTKKVQQVIILNEEEYCIFSRDEVLL